MKKVFTNSELDTRCDAAAVLARTISRKLKAAGFIKKSSYTGFSSLKQGLTVSRLGYSGTVIVDWDFQSYALNEEDKERRNGARKEVREFLEKNGYKLDGTKFPLIYIDV